MIWSVPSKSFILGEYWVVFGGKAIIWTHTPRFEAKIIEAKNTLIFDSQLPLELAPHEKLLQKMIANGFQKKIQFKNPYPALGFGQGGFGFSSAQFIITSLFNHSEDPWTIYDTFRELSESPGARPSGADLLAQMHGGCPLINPDQRTIEPLESLFPPTFFLFSASHQTDRKVATHEHLEGLQSFDASKLGVIFKTFCEALIHQDWVVLGSALTDYAQQLKNYGLEHPKTTFERAMFCGIDGVLGVKGCGALGADGLIVFIDPKNSAAFIKVQQEGMRLGLKLIKERFEVEKGVLKEC